MKINNIGIIGATGAVGKEILKVLEERNFEVDNLKVFGNKSKGKPIQFMGKEYIIENVDEHSFKDLDVVISAVSSGVIKEIVPYIQKSRAVLIDNSSAFRLREDVPLVVPEINKGEIFNHNGIIANPNCTTIITLVGINGINKLSKITRILASTYQAVSGAGIEGITELESQINAFSNNDKLVKKVFSHEILNNLIPQIGDFDDMGYTEEEMKLLNETRKILNNPEIKISCTSVRVPVMRSHSVSVTVETEKVLNIQDVRNEISKSEGVKLIDDIERQKYPTPKMSTDQDLVLVGRIRRDISTEGINLWCCGDQIRKGASTNAVQIAEILRG